MGTNELKVPPGYCDDCGFLIWFRSGTECVRQSTEKKRQGVTMSPNLIVMLTHRDKSVPHALDVFEECKDCSVAYWGFKDQGLTIGPMKRLADAIKRARKTVCFEVVHYSETECLESAHVAVEMGVD